MCKILAKFCIFMVPLVTVKSTNVASWWLQYGDVSGYAEVAKVRTASRFQCLIKIAAGLGAQVARFDEATGDCIQLACKMGSSGCRKCRNINNSAFSALWMRDPLIQSSNCWVTFQHRVDGSISFNRSWTDYINGFGQGENLNYWMGLDLIHNMTRDGVWRVRWEFSDWSDNWYWAENTYFSVTNASDKYRAAMGPLDTSNSNVGQETNAAWSMNNQKFSTFEVDNDQRASENCARVYSAGWWFGYCALMNPNGQYYVPPNALNTTGTTRGMYYYRQSSPGVFALIYSMKTFECMIRK